MLWLESNSMNFVKVIPLPLSQKDLRKEWTRLTLNALNSLEQDFKNTRRSAGVFVDYYLKKMYDVEDLIENYVRCVIFLLVLILGYNFVLFYL